MLWYIFWERDKILISIKGVSSFMSLAYLGVVPGVKSSGGKTYTGRINKAYRKLARTVFTQSIHHVIASSKSYQETYEDLKIRRGAGRTRIAFIRRIFGVMRRMLLSETSLKWLRNDLYDLKLKKYYRDIKK